ncbi:MAG: hypothetical protein M3546_10935 [Actinomycetota bacterium]|nr:hypothetical protein [Actinomycetota bacterium]
MLVEYASLVAAMAVLTASLTGAFGQKLAVLPTSSGAALSTLSAAAGAQRVPAGEARTAYKRAPYSKPVLKYLYAVGWIGGKKSPLSCLFARTQPSETEQEALTEIKGNGKLVKQLRRVHVGQKLAASVVVKGIASACS